MPRWLRPHPNSRKGTASEYPRSLLLNAGDEFTGTLFHTVYKGEKIAETLNDLKFDAMTLGNHEWDEGDAALGDFIKTLKFHVVSCNVETTDLALQNTFEPYHIFEAHQLAVIGVTTESTATTSQVGPGTTFLDPIAAVKTTIEEIRSKFPQIKRLVALSHLGYQEDLKLAAQTEGLALIIGGHTNTLLGKMPGAEGPYPTAATNLKGDQVYVVQAYRWGEYLGSVQVTFDPSGKAISCEGEPIRMDKTIEPDKDLQNKITGWRSKPLFAQYEAQVGTTKTALSGEECWQKDCLLGQVLADSMLEYGLGNELQHPAFALVNAGIVRASLPSGVITKGDLKTCFPFETTLVAASFTGQEIRSVIEGCVSGVNKEGKKVTSWFQVSDGLSVSYDATKEPGSRVREIRVNGQLLDEKRSYRIVTSEYLLAGGDNMLPTATSIPRNEVRLGSLDNTLSSYFSAKSPLDVKLKKRVSTVKVKQPVHKVSVEEQQSVEGVGQGVDVEAKEPVSPTEGVHAEEALQQDESKGEARQEEATRQEELARQEEEEAREEELAMQREAARLAELAQEEEEARQEERARQEEARQGDEARLVKQAEQEEKTKQEDKPAQEEDEKSTHPPQETQRPDSKPKDKDKTKDKTNPDPKISKTQAAAMAAAAGLAALPAGGAGTGTTLSTLRGPGALAGATSISSSAEGAAAGLTIPLLTAEAATPLVAEEAITALISELKTELLIDAMLSAAPDVPTTAIGQGASEGSLLARRSESDKKVVKMKDVCTMNWALAVAGPAMERVLGGMCRRVVWDARREISI